MLNKCIGCYYHDSKKNICTHGSPIFIDDICTDYQDSEFVKQIKANVIEELLDISWHSIDLKDFRREVMNLKEQK